jgi:hypothetical protein
MSCWQLNRGPGANTARNLALVLCVCSLLAAPACSSADSKDSRGMTDAGGAGLPGQGPGGAYGAAGTGNVSGGGLAGGASQASEVTLKASWDFVHVSRDSAVTVDCTATGHSVVYLSISGPNLASAWRWYETCSNTVPFNTIIAIAPGNYTATFGLLDNVFDTEAAPEVPVSIPFEVPVGDVEVVIPHAHITFARYSFAWTVQQAGAASNCSAVGAEFLAISWSQSGTTTKLTTVCSQASLSKLFEPGNYPWKAELLSSSRSVIATYQPAEPLIVTPMSASALSPFVFDIPAP